ncbi:MAG: OsmC family protein [Gammaproteobacteria bacterium]
MKIKLNKIGPIAFEATTESGHTVIMDGAAEGGGGNLGSRPMEMILMGLGGCSGIDVALILEKSRQQVSDCVIDIDAQRADAVPAVFTDIHLHYTVSGAQLDPNKVERAVSLSMEKYCSVTRMLEPSVNITHDFSIVEE